MAIALLSTLCAGCLPAAITSGGMDSQPDLGIEKGTGPTPSATPYFNPDIQHDLDTLGCTASACHGSSASPVMTAMPSNAAAWMSNYTNIHIDCTTLDCLTGGAASLLLTKPLQGGPAHSGTKPFASSADPTYQRWLTWLNAGAPYDSTGSIAAPSTDMAMGGAMDLGAHDMAPGERVTISFTTTASPDSAGSQFTPKNVVVVWIESSAGVFVKTAARWANTRRTHLVGWIAKAGNADVDAVSGATQPNYGKLTATWDMTARAGGAAPVDGVYTIRMELADNNTSQTTQNNEGTFTFNRNGTASTQSALSNGGFTGVSIQYSGR